MKEQIKAFFDRDWSKTEKIMLTAGCIMGGMLIGMIFFPRKKNTMIGSHNGCGNKTEEEMLDEELSDDIFEEE